MNIPKSKITENQYTNGTGIGKNITLRFTISKIPYVGFYNIVNGTKYFTGRTYTDKSKSLERYNLIATASSLVASAGSVVKLADNLSSSDNTIRYFYKDLTASPNILIKEINRDTYAKLNGAPSMTYQVISYNPRTQTLDELDKQMPGLKIFVET